MLPFCPSLRPRSQSLLSGGSTEQSTKYEHEIRRLGWIIEPTLNQLKSVAYYAIEVQFGDALPIVDTIIYDFGRHGYEEMTLVQENSDFPSVDATSIAKGIADAYEFGAGNRYQDFRTSDTVAALGAGGLNCGCAWNATRQGPFGGRDSLSKEGLVPGLV